MQDLRLIGVHEDGHHLLLADADGGRYRLTLDEALRAAARRDRPRLGQLQIEIEGGLRPREVQALIRRGLSAEEVADRAGLDRREGAPLRGAGARRARARRPGRPEVRRRQPRFRPGDPRGAGVRAAARPWGRPRRRRVGLRPRRRGGVAADPDLRRRWAAAHRHLALRAAGRLGDRHQRRGALAERGGRARRDPDPAPGRPERRLRRVRHRRRRRGRRRGAAARPARADRPDGRDARALHPGSPSPPPLTVEHAGRRPPPRRRPAHRGPRHRRLRRAPAPRSTRPQPGLGPPRGGGPTPPTPTSSSAVGPSTTTPPGRSPRRRTTAPTRRGHRRRRRHRARQ